MPDMSIAIAIMLGSFIILLMLRMPISFTLGISSALTALYLNIPLATVFQRMVSGVQSFSLLAIPFFILAGEIMGQGGISRRLIALANACVGWMRGGLAQVNILASMFFGGISGSAVADTSSIGSILIPMMTDSGYDKDFSVAVTVTSSCQGVMIPPSHNMILFAMAAGGGVSIGQLFMGGLIPGIILGIALMIMTAIIARKRNYPKGRVLSVKEIWKVTKDALLGLMTCIIIVGGVIFGWFTATESAAVAVVYAFIITFFVYREIPLRQFGNILRKSLRTIGHGHGAYRNGFHVRLASGLPEDPGYGYDRSARHLHQQDRYLAAHQRDVPHSRLHHGHGSADPHPDADPSAGCDSARHGAGYSSAQCSSSIWPIGLCTPPVGAALFAGAPSACIKIEHATKACLPFYAMMILVLMLVTFVQPISMFVPHLMAAMGN